MKTWLLSVALVLGCFCFDSRLSGPLHASLIPIYFGTQDTIRELQPIPDTDYILCHKLHALYFFGGIYVKDDGYVLKEKVKVDNRRGGYRLPTPEKYIPLTTEKIAELQQAGVLPNPLPPYSLTRSDYVSGFSLWIFLLFGAALLALRLLVEKWWNQYTAPQS